MAERTKTTGEVRTTILKAIGDRCDLKDVKNIHFSDLNSAEVMMADGGVTLYRWDCRRGEYFIFVSNSP